MSSGYTIQGILWQFVLFGGGKIREVGTFISLDRDGGRTAPQEYYHDYDISDPKNPVFVAFSNSYTHSKNEGWGIQNGIRYSKENPSPSVSEETKEELKRGFMMKRYYATLEESQKSQALIRL
jgi:hypothetical protein